MVGSSPRVDSSPISSHLDLCGYQHLDLGQRFVFLMRCESQDQEIREPVVGHSLQSLDRVRVRVKEL